MHLISINVMKSIKIIDILFSKYQDQSYTITPIMRAGSLLHQKSEAQKVQKRYFKHIKFLNFPSHLISIIVTTVYQYY